MLTKILLFIFVIPLNLFAQTKFTSSKYNYSFIFPDGWHQKDKIFIPDVDAKISDNKGNSFIVSVKTFPTATQLTAKQQLAKTYNQALEEQFNAVYGTTEIVKRGSFQIGLKEFYYFHLLTPYADGHKLYHKLFFYSEGYRMLTIDACAIDSYVDETSLSFVIMISTFEFQNLKNKGVKK